MSSRPILDGSGYDAPAANTAAEVVIAGQNGLYIIIVGLQWSYNGAPTGGGLVITENAANVWGVDIPTSGVGFVPPNDNLGWRSEIKARPVTVTLAAGGAGVTGKLNVQWIYASE